MNEIINWELLNAMLVDEYIGLIVFSFIIVVPMNFSICWLVHVVVELLIAVG